MFNIENYQKKLGKDVAIFQTPHYVDVFYSTGWESPIRFKKEKNKTLKQINPNKQQVHLPLPILQQVTAEVFK